MKPKQSVCSAVFIFTCIYFETYWALTLLHAWLALSTQHGWKLYICWLISLFWTRSVNLLLEVTIALYLVIDLAEKKTRFFKRRLSINDLPAPWTVPYLDHLIFEPIERKAFPQLDSYIWLTKLQLDNQIVPKLTLNITSLVITSSILESPETLISLRQLQKLKLWDVPLKTWQDIPSVKELTIGSCGLKKIKLKSGELQRVKLMYNSISKIDLQTSNLEALDLTSNRIETLDLDHCTQLRKVYVQHNCLAELHLGHCTQLRKLDVSANCLTTLDLRGLQLEGFLGDGNCFTCIRGLANVTSVISVDSCLPVGSLSPKLSWFFGKAKLGTRVFSHDRHNLEYDYITELSAINCNQKYKLLRSLL